MKSKKILKYLKNPGLFFRVLFNKIFYSPMSAIIPDGTWLKYNYRLRTGGKLDLRNPKTFNEKLQWLKLYDRDPDYSSLVDKYEVRKYIAETIGEEFLIPLYGVWDSFDEIPFDALPDQFVLKCTHDSASVVICQDKNSLDMAGVRKYFIKKLAQNYYWPGREWVYKNIKPRIIAEKLMVDESGVELKDYKIFCFNGEPKIIEVIFDRHIKNPKINLYSTKWEYQPFMAEYPTAPEIIIQRPQSLALMLGLAKKISSGKNFLRIDFYLIEDKLYFGELTFYPTSGYIRFDPPKWNRTFGDWVSLPISGK